MSQPQGSTRTETPLTVGRIADHVGGRLEGDGDVEITGVAPLDEAGPGDLAFLARKRYARLAEASEATAYLTTPDLEAYLPAGASRVVVTDPYPSLRLVLESLYAADAPHPQIHPTAVLGRGVRLGHRVDVGAYAVLEDDVVVGEGCRIGAHCVLGRGTSIGAGSVLHPHVVTYPGTALGSRVIVHAGARIGADGFGYTRVGDEHLKMPQVGRAVVGDDVEIGANTTIDRGALGDTVIGRGSKIDNLVQVAHNVRVGAGSLLAALVGIAGSTKIGRHVWLGGRASAINHLEIGDGARIAFGSTVMRDVPAGETVSGAPSRPHREQLRRQAEVGRLAALKDRVRRLEEAVGP